MATDKGSDALLREAALNAVDAVAGRPLCPTNRNPSWENGWLEGRAACHRALRAALDATNEPEPLDDRIEAAYENGRRDGRNEAASAIADRIRRMAFEGGER